VTGPEPLTGSTRLKAGTAQKMVLNLLSTGAMVRTGKTYGNLMVDVRASNAKLRDRAVRIVAAATGIDRDAARAALDRCDWHAKPAIVAVKLGVPPAEAEALLAASGGFVRVALGEAARL
jgi:N-acetylmuramic acid 6-phosphate etherase